MRMRQSLFCCEKESFMIKWQKEKQKKRDDIFHGRLQL